MILYMRNKGLADFIRDRMLELNLSAADVARRSDNEISPTTITKILNHEVKDSGSRTLAAIAKGIDVDKVELFRLAVGDDINTPLHIQIFAERFDGDDMTENDWDALENIFRDSVEKWRSLKDGHREFVEREAIASTKLQKRQREQKGKIAALITPANNEMTRDEVKHSIDKYVTVSPVKKRKAG